MDKYHKLKESTFFSFVSVFLNLSISLSLSLSLYPSIIYLSILSIFVTIYIYQSIINRINIFYLSFHLSVFLFYPQKKQ